MLGSAHRHEADNHATSLEISTYLWQVLKLLYKKDKARISIQYSGNYIYNTTNELPDLSNLDRESGSIRSATLLPIGPYFCEPTDNTNYIALYTDAVWGFRKDNQFFIWIRS